MEFYGEEIEGIWNGIKNINNNNIILLSFTAKGNTFFCLILWALRIQRSLLLLLLPMMDREMCTIFGHRFVGTVGDGAKKLRRRNTDSPWRGASYIRWENKFRGPSPYRWGQVNGKGSDYSLPNSPIQWLPQRPQQANSTKWKSISYITYARNGKAKL